MRERASNMEVTAFCNLTVEVTYHPSTILFVSSHTHSEGEDTCAHFGSTHTKGRGHTGASTSGQGLLGEAHDTVTVRDLLKATQEMDIIVLLCISLLQKFREVK